MKCPICKKEVKIGDPEMPFCSERCRLIDLGNWSSEKYVISEPVSPEILGEPYVNGHAHKHSIPRDASDDDE